MSSSPARVALYAPVYRDYIHQIVEGILAYQAQFPRFTLTDCRYRIEDMLRMPRPDAVPRWAGRVDGVISYVGGEPEIYEWLLRGGVPVVNTSADQIKRGLPTVCCDAGSICAVAVEHLMQMEYSHFAHVGYRSTHGSHIRETAFDRALADRGHELIKWRLDYPAESPTTDAAEVLAVDPWLGQALRNAPKPLGILVLNDSFASAISAVCHAEGLAIPEDVGILSIGDSCIDRLNNPPLSSIQLPGSRVGYEAMALLDELMLGQATTTIRKIPVGDVAVRQSTCGATVPDEDIQLAMRMIASDACRGITVSELITALRMSRKTFERRFQEARGHAPGEEIRRVRTERARELLARSDLSITRISRMVGFNRSSLFTRFFKERTGQTPRDFRKGAGGFSRN